MAWDALPLSGAGPLEDGVKRDNGDDDADRKTRLDSGSPDRAE